MPRPFARLVFQRILCGFRAGGAVRHLADGAVTAVCAVSLIRPGRELMSRNVAAALCLARLIVIAGDADS